METSIKKIKKRNGEVVEFNPEKITNAIFKAVVAVGGTDKEEAERVSNLILKKLEEKGYNGNIPSVEEVQDAVEEVLVKEGHIKTANAYQAYRKKRADIRKAKKMLGIYDDTKINLNALKVLEHRYLLKDENGKIIETPSELFMRVAKAIAKQDIKYDENADIEETKKTFYEMMKNLEFLPNSPTLMNAGTELGQLSACFVLPVGDSMEEIFDAVKNTAIIHKSGGGTGFSFSRLRPSGDFVKSTSGVSSGPLSFMKVFNVATEVIKQGGCIASDSLIRTDKGIVPMCRLLNCPSFGSNPTKYTVYTNGEFENAFLSEDNNIAEVIKIKTDIGTEIGATYNHQIGVINKEGEFSWKTAEKIIEGDWIIHVLGGHIGEDIELPKIKEQHFNATKLRIPKKMNEELAEIIGIFTADGCISSGGRIIFSVADKEDELKNRIIYLMQNLFGLELGRIERKEGDNSSCLIFYSEDLCRYFKKCEWNKKGAKNARVPSMIFESSTKSAKSFLRGLFEGDGHIHVDGYPTLSSISENLVKEVQQLLMGLGIISKVSVNKNRKTSFGKNPVFVLSIIQEGSAKKFVEEIGFVSKHKNKKLISRQKDRDFEYNDVIPNQEKRLRQIYENSNSNRELYRAIQHYIAGVKPVTKRNLTRKRLKILIKNFKEIQSKKILKIVDDKYFYSRVVEKSKDKKHTMDIMIPTAEKFVANGVLVHNKRRGANMGILRVDHPNILDFISSKEEEGVLNNFNISVGLTKKFMDSVKKKEKYELINPRDKKVVGKLDAEDVFNLIATLAWKSGDPGIIFLDKINEENPTPEIGEIESTNPCGEQPLLPYESCNLGSINLSKMVKKTGKYYEIDWRKLKETIRNAVHFLDNVIDANKYPLQEIDEMSRNNRKIGLGVMGFADLLIKLRIPYNSDKGVAIADEIMNFVTKEAEIKSRELAEERGVFPNWEKSIYSKKGIKRRNATVTTIAPTGTLSIIAGCSSGVEPLFAISYVRKHILGGEEMLEVNPLFEQIAREKDFYSEELMEKIARKGTIYDMEDIPRDVRKIFVTAHDISPEWHVMMQAIFQKHTENAVSKTVNFSKSASVADIKKVYMLAYDLDCKGITIYRDQSKSEQVLNIDRKEDEEKEEEKIPKEIIKSHSLSEFEKHEEEDSKKDIIVVDAEYAGGCSTCHL